MQDALGAGQSPLHNAIAANSVAFDDGVSVLLVNYQTVFVAEHSLRLSFRLLPFRLFIAKITMDVFAQLGGGIRFDKKRFQKDIEIFQVR